MTREAKVLRRAIRGSSSLGSIREDLIEATYLLGIGRLSESEYAGLVADARWRAKRIDRIGKEVSTHGEAIARACNSAQGA